MKLYVIEMVSIGNGEILQIGMSLDYEVAKKECEKINYRYEQSGLMFNRADITTYEISEKYTKFNF